MHPQTVFAKTAKGILEIKNKTIKLSRDFGLVFLSVDGKSTVADLAQKSGMPAPKLEEALDKLVSDGYIKIFTSPAVPAAAPTTRAAAAPAPAPAQDIGDDLDFTSPQAVAKLNAEAETRARAEGDAKNRALVAARAAAEAKVRQEAGARARAARLFGRARRGAARGGARLPRARRPSWPPRSRPRRRR